MSKFFLSQFLGFILFSVSFFLCRINLENRVLLVSYVELLRTELTISLSELRVDRQFLPIDENLSFHLEFSSVEPTEVFTSSDMANSFLCRQKSNNTASRP